MLVNLLIDLSYVFLATRGSATDDRLELVGAHRRSVLLAAAARYRCSRPWLGTVDPTLFDAASRDLRPGAAGEITTLEGETLKHTF